MAHNEVVTISPESVQCLGLLGGVVFRESDLILEGLDSVSPDVQELVHTDAVRVVGIVNCVSLGFTTPLTDVISAFATHSSLELEEPVSDDSLLGVAMVLSSHVGVYVVPGKTN